MFLENLAHWDIALQERPFLKAAPALNPVAEPLLALRPLPVRHDGQANALPPPRVHVHVSSERK